MSDEETSDQPTQAETAMVAAAGAIRIFLATAYPDDDAHDNLQRANLCLGLASEYTAKVPAMLGRNLLLDKIESDFRQRVIERAAESNIDGGIAPLLPAKPDFGTILGGDRSDFYEKLADALGDEASARFFNDAGRQLELQITKLLHAHLCHMANVMHVPIPVCRLFGIAIGMNMVARYAIEGNEDAPEPMAADELAEIYFPIMEELFESVAALVREQKLDWSAFDLKQAPPAGNA